MKTTINTKNARSAAYASALLLALAACGDDDTTPANDASIAMDGEAQPDSGVTGDAATGDAGETEGPAYAFESRFDAPESSVDYSGQAARQVLIADITTFIGRLTTLIDSETLSFGEIADVVGALNYYFRFDGDSSGEDTFLLSTTPTALQSTWNEISANKLLADKLAGNDTSTDHVDWSTAFRGWSDASIATHGGGITNPEAFVTALFSEIGANAIARAEGTTRTSDGDPSEASLPVHLTESGIDLQQLVQKFLLGAVNFSQGADDYLDSDVAGKGLLAPNTRDGDKPWTILEHQWDEGFGYWGGARDYDQYTDEEIAGSGGRENYRVYHDTDGDGRIDLRSEYNFGASTNAAKRDLGSVVATDFTRDAFEAFVEGRAIIAAAGETLTTDEVARLEDARDRAVRAWENALAATAVHYINDVLQDMNKFGEEGYSFADHAKHWSELKGFALSFQFNPRSPLTDSDFAMLHTLLGDAPVLSNASTTDQDTYRANLRAARTLLGTAYGFANENLGDNDGEGGW